MRDRSVQLDEGQTSPVGWGQTSHRMGDRPVVGWGKDQSSKVGDRPVQPDGRTDKPSLMRERQVQLDGGDTSPVRWRTGQSSWTGRGGHIILGRWGAARPTQSERQTSLAR